MARRPRLEAVRAVHRRQVLVIGGVLILQAAFITLVMIWNEFGDYVSKLRGAVLGFNGLALLVITAISVWTLVRLKAIMRTAGAHDGRICRRCTYPMSDDFTQCPECGHAQDMQQTVADWQRLLRDHPKVRTRTDGVSGLLGPDRNWGD